MDKEIAEQPKIDLYMRTWDCPRCHAVYKIPYDFYRYCPKCGQMINQKNLKKLMPTRGFTIVGTKNYKNFYSSIMDLIKDGVSVRATKSLLMPVYYVEIEFGGEDE